MSTDRCSTQGGLCRTYFKTALVTVLTTSIFLFCYLIDTATATALNDSAVSAFYYADKLFTPLTTSVLYSISAVMFPRFNREFTRRTYRRGTSATSGT